MHFALFSPKTESKKIVPSSSQWVLPFPHPTLQEFWAWRFDFRSSLSDTAYYFFKTRPKNWLSLVIVIGNSLERDDNFFFVLPTPAFFFCFLFYYPEPSPCMDMTRPRWNPFEGAKGVRMLNVLVSRAYPMGKRSL